MTSDSVITKEAVAFLVVFIVLVYFHLVLVASLTFFNVHILFIAVIFLKRNRSISNELSKNATDIILPVQGDRFFSSPLGSLLSLRRGFLSCASCRSSPDFKHSYPDNVRLA